jgi:hypothetical protein
MRSGTRSSCQTAKTTAPEKLTRSLTVTGKRCACQIGTQSPIATWSRPGKKTLIAMPRQTEFACQIETWSATAKQSQTGKRTAKQCACQIETWSATAKQSQTGKRTAKQCACQIETRSATGKQFQTQSVTGKQWACQIGTQSPIATWSRPGKKTQTAMTSASR